MGNFKSLNKIVPFGLDKLPENINNDIVDATTLLLTPLGALFIILGLLQQKRSFTESNIRWANAMKGVKTEITKETITAQKVTGVIFIILGIVIFLLAFVIIPSLVGIPSP